MPAWTAIVVDGAVVCAALGLVIVGSLAYNPRLWVNDLPPRARALVPPLTAAERRDRNVVAALFLLAIVATTTWSAARLIARHGGAVSFATAFGHFLAVFFLFNLFDLVVIDWLMLLVFQPAFLRRLSVPGLTYVETVGGFGYHFQGFLKGMGFILAAGAIAAGLTALAA
jgi:hypothetical protein